MVGGSKCRNDSMALQVEEIWCGAEEARIVLLRSWDLERESTVYECRSVVGTRDCGAECREMEVAGAWWVW